MVESKKITLNKSKVQAASCVVIRDFPKHSFFGRKKRSKSHWFRHKMVKFKEFFCLIHWFIDESMRPLHRIFPSNLSESVKASEAGDCVESFNLTILALDIGEKVFGTPWNPSHEMLRDWTTSSKGVWMYRVRFLFLKSSNPMTDSDANQHALPHERACVFWLANSMWFWIKKSHMENFNGQLVLEIGPTTLPEKRPKNPRETSFHGLELDSSTWKLQRQNLIFATES